jgi:hypothetical protein
MTNKKLPEVGKRYKRLDGLCKWIEILSIDPEGWTGYRTDKGAESNVRSYVFFEYFEELRDQPTSVKSAQVGSKKVEKTYSKDWGDGYEAALEDCRLQKDLKSGISEKVEECLEKLKKHQDGWIPWEHNFKTKDYLDNYKALYDLGQNLVNALEENQETKLEAAPEPAISKKGKTDSIWKPISELSEENQGLLLTRVDKNHVGLSVQHPTGGFCQLNTIWGNGNFNRHAIFSHCEVKEYSTLTDFANQVEAIAKNQEIIFAEIAKLKNK